MVLNVVLTMFAFLVALAILVGFHELGHFVIAKFFKVKVLRFAIGFGKPIWRWIDKNKTEYVLAILPLGGYVKLLDSREGEVPAAELPFAFDKKPIYQRAAILVAGPVANIVLAILLYWLIFSLGFIQIKPVIGPVIANSIAAKAGLKTGDEIIAIDDSSTHSWTAVAIKLEMHYGESRSLKMTVRPLFKAQTIAHVANLNLESWQLDKLHPNVLKSLGIKPYRPAQLLKDVIGKPQWPTNLLVKTQYSPLFALWPALKQVGIWTKLNFVILYKLITGFIAWSSLGGPLSILHGAGAAINQGMVTYCSFLAFLSINVAVMNMLPIPGLDGGQLVCLAIEWIRRRPLSIAFQILVFRLSIILFCIFFFQLLRNDLIRLL